MRLENSIFDSATFVGAADQEQTFYEEKISRSALFRVPGKLVDNSVVLQACPLYQIHAKSLWEKLLKHNHYDYKPEKIPKLFLIWPEAKRLQVIRYYRAKQGGQHIFTPLSQARALSDLYSPLLSFAIAGALELKECVQEIISACRDATSDSQSQNELTGITDHIKSIFHNPDFQTSAIEHSGVEMAHYLFDEMKITPDLPKLWACAFASNNFDLLNYLWDRFPEERSLPASVVPKVIPNASNVNIFKFLLTKKDQGFSWKISERSIRNILCSGELELIALLCRKVPLQPHHCLSARSDEALQMVLPYCKPDYRILMAALIYYGSPPSPHTLKVISHLLDYAEATNEQYPLSEPGVFSALVLFPEKRISQQYIFNFLLNSSQITPQEKEAILKHRELLVYQPLLRSTAINSRPRGQEIDNCVYRLWVASGKAAEALPGEIMSNDQANLPEMQKIKTLLSDGFLSSYPDRLLAHIFLLQLLQHSADPQFIQKAKKLGPEKIYNALMERLELTERSDLSLELQWLKLARDSGIFENKKLFGFFGTNYYEEIQNKIQALNRALTIVALPKERVQLAVEACREVRNVANSNNQPSDPSREPRLFEQERPGAAESQAEDSDEIELHEMHSPH